MPNAPAIFKAVGEGERRIVALALAAAPQEEQPPFSGYPAPCGICLQVLSEFAAPELRVLLAKSREDYQLCTMRDLFPKRFTAARLEGRNPLKQEAPAGTSGEKSPADA